MKRFRCFSQSHWYGQQQPHLLIQSAALAIALIRLTNLSGRETGLRLVAVSPRFCTLLGYQAADLVNQTVVEQNLWANLDWYSLLPELDRQPLLTAYKWQLRHQSGQMMDAELTIEALQMDRQPHLMVIISDVSQLAHCSNRRMVASLHAAVQDAQNTQDGQDTQDAQDAQDAQAEKEVLLKEIHHRVRNNLHLISNLLDLQAGTLNDERLSQLFAPTQNRIQVMTLIYEQLYQSDNLSRVEFGEYLKRLTLNVFLAISSYFGSIKPVIQVEPVWLNLETAIPCGLLINELLVNSLQHAFPNQRLGEIQVQLQQIHSRIHIIIQDNGIGLPPHFDWQQTSSLGLKLVRILAKQLNAEVSFTSNGGTTVQLEFSELNYKSRF
ncbi:MAG: hypothetical protein IGS54_13575 [Elainella sp. C42_A2020_010]|nr:hypothetical protein [Elainella sp. C42_A2020_010]